MATPCTDEYGKYEKAYRNWDRKDSAVDRWSAAYVAADIAMVAGCVGSLGSGCAALVAAFAVALAELLDAEDERDEAAEEANGAFADYLICTVKHKNYYKDEDDDD
jgi:hypothetical protein